MTTAIEQAARNEDIGKYVAAFWAFAESAGLVDAEAIPDTANIREAFEAQGVLPMEDAEG
jgi:hypothetical protein